MKRGGGEKMKKANVLVIIDGNLKEVTLKAKHVNDIKWILWDVCKKDFEIIDVRWLTD